MLIYKAFKFYMIFPRDTFYSVISNDDEIYNQAVTKEN